MSEAREAVQDTSTDNGPGARTSYASGPGLCAVTLAAARAVFLHHAQRLAKRRAPGPAPQDDEPPDQRHSAD